MPIFFHGTTRSQTKTLLQGEAKGLFLTEQEEVAYDYARERARERGEEGVLLRIYAPQSTVELDEFYEPEDREDLLPFWIASGGIQVLSMKVL